MNEFKDLEILESGKHMLLFSNDTCPDCIMLSMYIDKIVEKYQDEWQFWYVERDINLELAKHYDVFGIPSFVAIEDGKKIADFISKESKSYDEIVQFIDGI